MDSGKEDRFTSSREGVVSGDEIFDQFLKTFDEQIRPIILKEWDQQRRLNDSDGDAEETSEISPRDRKIEEATRQAIAEYKTGNQILNKWLKQTRQHAEFNFKAYQDCYMCENLLREYVKSKRIQPVKCVKADKKSQLNCVEFLKSKNLPLAEKNLCVFCLGQNRTTNFKILKSDAKISIQIRADELDPLSYLDYTHFAGMVGHKHIKNEELPYKPLRNSVMHAVLLTDVAERRLRSVFDNVVASVKEILKVK